MKFCILGPVETPSCLGGVAIFDIGLAKALKCEGMDVFIATDQKDSVSTVKDGIHTYKVNAKTFVELIKKENPDVIITELAYARFLFGLKSNAIKIYFLHSYFKQSYYGKLKSILAVIYQKILLTQCDLVFSNSYFTEMINSDFFGIESNAVFHAGVTEDYLKTIEANSGITKRKNTVFFAGRFVPAKGVDKIIEAFQILSQEGVDCELMVAGDGPEREKLLYQAQSGTANITFLGRVSQEEIVKKYLESDVFVSLDVSEPYGIVFPEALLANCKIVCPYTGGQVEYLSNHPDSVCYINRRSARSIADGIKKMFEYGKAPNLTAEQKEGYTYRNSAKGIIEYVTKWRNCNGK